MELSEEDIVRLESRGHRREDFSLVGEDGIPRLRNVKGRCYFLGPEDDACTEYESRPLGCEIYPVNCDEEGEVFVDDFCTAKGTLSEVELREKGPLLKEHLSIIDKEAEGRRRSRGR